MALGKREKCANIGCNNLQSSSSGKLNQPRTRYRAVCGSCHEHSYKGLCLPLGKKDFKKYECSNQDGRLGFPCATDHTKIIDKKGKFQIDHINGDCTNNTLNNLQELCLNCHQQKSMLAGDYAKTSVRVKSMEGHVLFESTITKDNTNNKNLIFDHLFN